MKVYIFEVIVICVAIFYSNYIDMVKIELKFQCIHRITDVNGRTVLEQTSNIAEIPMDIESALEEADIVNAVYTYEVLTQVIETKTILTKTVSNR